MTTEKQLAANRRNAQKSTGPRTPEGKTIASQNALAHGLLADRVLIYDENPDEFNVFYQSVLRDLAPVGEMEIFLAERIIAIMWRLKRTGRMESSLLNELCSRQEENDRFRKSFSMVMVETVTGARYPDKESFALPRPNQPSTLFGRIVKSDFAGSNLITRLLRYEGEMDRYLHKTILELQKLQYIRKQKEAICE